MAHPIKKGDRIKILPNLLGELRRLKFEAPEPFAHKWGGVICTAHDLWTDADGQVYVTVDLCCEVPIQCCEPVEQYLSGSQI